jgi:amidase
MAGGISGRKESSLRSGAERAGGWALWFVIAVSSCSQAPASPASAAPEYDVEEKSIATLQADLTSGLITSEALVGAYLRRIEAIDRGGPTLNSVLAVNPAAVGDARALDAERRSGRVRGPLHGIPILVKDNIDTIDPLPTTAGSLAMVANITARDAPAIARLRAAGAIVLGKTNLSEWANIRSSRSTSGWSAVGGLTRNPYALDRNACGSSAGSGVAAAASLAAATIGTETDGSIVCPSAANGLVGIKPTVGLVSRTHIVPISHSQDTAGPMARSVADAALLLAAMAGRDPLDTATKDADTRRADYPAALDRNALKGVRLAALRFLGGYHAETDAAFDAAIAALKAAGADVVDVPAFDARADVGAAELTVLLTELKVDLDAYLSSTPREVVTRSLADVIAFNRGTPAETVLFGQELFERAAGTKGLRDPAYLAALEKARRLAGPEGIDRMLRTTSAAALLAPTGGPAWTTDVVNGDHFLGAASELPAVAGYPHITVPMGNVTGLPVGLSFIGGAWSETRLIGLAFAFEQHTRARMPPRYLSTIAAAVTRPPSPTR